MPGEKTTPRPCARKAKYSAEPELCLHRGHSQHGSRVPLLISTIPNFPKVAFLTKTFTPQLLPLGRRLKGGSHQAVDTRPPVRPFTLWVHAPSCSPALLSVNTSYTNPVPGLSVSEGLRVYARDFHPVEHQRSPSHPTPVSLVQGDKQERKMKTLL